MHGGRGWPVGNAHIRFTHWGLFPLVRGEIFGTWVSCEARRAELSRYKFVCRWRYPGGTGEDQCGALGRAFEVQICLSVAMSGGTGEEQCGAQGQAFEVQVCLSVAMSGGTGEEQCGAQGRAFEVQVCLSVAMSYGVLTSSGRRQFSREFFVNVARKWRETSSLL